MYTRFCNRLKTLHIKMYEEKLMYDILKVL